MKTRIATLAILLGLLISTTAFASEPVPASKFVSTSVADYIENEMEYPEFAIKQKLEGDVLIQIEIRDDGAFDVVQANAYNADMKKHVINLVENLDTEKFAQYAGQTVLVKVSFDLELY